jgi:hypothetical protein
LDKDEKQLQEGNQNERGVSWGLGVEELAEVIVEDGLAENVSCQPPLEGVEGF